MFLRARFRFPAVVMAVFALVFTLSSCGDDEQSPTGPPPPQPTPAGWFRQDPHTVAALLSVAFVDASRGVVVGQGGNIRRTIDGGRTWTTPPTSTTERLNCVAFSGTGSGEGVIVGTTGTTLRTTDGGATWTTPTTPARAILNGVTFSGPASVSAVGVDGQAFFSPDAGDTWSPAPLTGGTSFDFISVSFHPIQGGGVAVGTFGLMAQSRHGGAGWARMTGAGSQFLRSVWFSDPSTGTVVGDGGTILRTTDGGQTWVPQRSGVIAALTGVCFNGHDIGTVVGYAGTILRTVDGGTNWVAQDSGTLLNLYAVTFTNPDSGTVVGEDGMVLRTVTGGFLDQVHAARPRR